MREKPSVASAPNEADPFEGVTVPTKVEKSDKDNKA